MKIIPKKKIKKIQKSEFPFRECIVGKRIVVSS